MNGPYGPPALTCYFQDTNPRGPMPAGRPQSSDQESSNLEKAPQYPPLKQIVFGKEEDCQGLCQIQRVQKIAVQGVQGHRGAIRGWLREAGRSAAGPGDHPLDTPLMVAGEAASP